MDLPAFLSVAKAAEIMGFRPMYVYKLIAEGKLKALRPGNSRLRIPREEFEKFLAASTARPIARVSKRERGAA